MSHTLPNLPYAYDALESVIDEQTMKIHHDLHHGAYVAKLNTALEGNAEISSMSVEELLKNINSVPENIRQAVINNAGGHANHTLFWEILTPGGSKEPMGELLEKINELCGDFEKFKEALSNEGLNRFGSGWAWLVVTSEGKLAHYATQNQDSPLMKGDTPILGIDVWEHAYYLKYQNRRPEYLQNIWNIVNWDKVNELYEASK